MLASEIADLAGLWLGIVTRRHFTTNIRVNMRTSGDAVAVRRNRHRVNMVYCIVS